MEGNITNMIDTTHPKALQVREALLLRESIRDAAKNSLIETGLGAHFAKRHQVPSLEEIAVTLKKTYSGDSLYDQEIK